MARSRVASPIGRRSERVKAMLAGCRWYDYTGGGLIQTLGCAARLLGVGSEYIVRGQTKGRE
jgi:hypothetical protein